MGKDLKIFSDKIEPKTIHQMHEAMSHPSVIRGVLMPDAHLGYSLPIGGVVVTDNFIFPSWVGYDIGCGVCAVKLENVSVSEIKRFKNEIFEEIYKRVPVGFNHGTLVEGLLDPTLEVSSDLVEIFQRTNAESQLGTLGGGNHFIEVGEGVKDKSSWVIIHSGSRGFGWNVAKHYMCLASPNGKASEGNWGFSMHSLEGKAYWADMNFCLHFALVNRKMILERVLDSIKALVGKSVSTSTFINRNHNHATQVLHIDLSGIIHRKGATHAEAGMMGVIPGNMRDGSFIVKGLGNSDSLWSSSHGAGRLMGRKEAKEKIDVRDFRKTMKESGIVAKVGKSTLDESPFAYKNIFEVMELQKDLVKTIERVIPIINVKAEDKRSKKDKKYKWKKGGKRGS